MLCTRKVTGGDPSFLGQSAEAGGGDQSPYMGELGEAGIWSRILHT